MPALSVLFGLFLGCLLALDLRTDCEDHQEVIQELRVLVEQSPCYWKVVPPHPVTEGEDAEGLVKAVTGDLLV